MPDLRPYRTDLEPNVFTALREERRIVYEDALLADCRDALSGGEASRSSGRESPQPSGGEAPSTSSHLTTLFWPGCSLASYSQGLTEATYRFLHERGLADGLTATCCGDILRYSASESERQAYTSTLAVRLTTRGVQRIIAGCPNCYYSLRELLSGTGGQGISSHFPQALADERSFGKWDKCPVPLSHSEGIEVLALPEVLVAAETHITPEMIVPATSVCIHDSCPDRRSGVFAASVRALFSDDIPRVEKRHHGEHSRCCGLGKLVFLRHPERSERRRQAGLDEFAATGADLLVTSCISCANAFSTSADEPTGDPSQSISAQHYLELLFSDGTSLNSA